MCAPEFFVLCHCRLYCHMYCLQYLSGEKKIARVADEEAVEAARLEADARRATTSRERDSHRTATYSSVVSGGTGARDGPSVRVASSNTVRTPTQEKLQPRSQLSVGLDGQEVAPIEPTSVPFESVTLVFRDLRCDLPL